MAIETYGALGWGTKRIVRKIAALAKANNCPYAAPSWAAPSLATYTRQAIAISVWNGTARIIAAILHPQDRDRSLR